MGGIWLLPVIIAVAAAVFVLIRDYLGRGRPEKKGPASSDDSAETAAPLAPWQPQPLLNGTERRVYELLKVRAPELTILAKVKLSDVVLPGVKPFTSEWQREYNRAGQKHVDFVLVGSTWMPLLVVEVDGAEHGSSKQRERDRVKDSVLASAGVPILRIDADWGGARMAEEIDGWLARLSTRRTTTPTPGKSRPVKL